MKGIYLNDIPFDLFLKYFSRQNLVDRVLRPKMINYLATVYTYQLSISGDTVIYKSIYPELDDIGDQLEVDLGDLFPENYTLQDLLTENSTVTSSGSITSDNPIFVDPANTMYVYPYEFYYEKVNGEKYYFADIDNGNIVDLRNENVIQGSVTIDDQGSRQVVISDGPLETVLGYLYYNKNFKIHAYNEDGDYLYIDQNGLDTTRKIDKNNFLYHNRLIRTNWFEVVDKDQLVRNFDAGKVGVLDTNLFKKAMFYEKFRITRTYEKVTKPATYELTNVKPAYRNTTGFNVELETTIEDVDKIVEVLNFANLKQLKAEYISYVPGTLQVKRSSIQYAFKGQDNVLIVTTKRFVSLKNKTYIVNSDDTVVTEEFGTVSLINQSLRIPVTQTPSVYRLTYKGRTISSVKIGNNNYFSFDNSDFLLQGSSGSYFIDYPVRITRREYPEGRNLFIGTITNIDQDVVTISPIQLTATELTVQNSFDTEGYEYDELTGNFTKISYYRDLLDSDFYVKLTETISKDSEFESPFSKFPIDLEMNAFIKKLSDENHYIVATNRGNIVKEDVYTEMRKNMTTSLTGEFINKRLDNYLIVNSGLYDSNSLMKMRIFAEGINNIILNDQYNLRQIKTRNSMFYITNLPKKLTIEKLQQNMLKIRNIEENRLTGIARVAELNAFQRIREYEMFPTNESRIKYYAELSKRETAYITFDKTEDIVNEIEEFDFSLIKNVTPRETFKKNIVNHFINGFFESEIEPLKYSKDFEAFYRNKMENLPAIYNDVNLNTEYKKVFTLDDVGTQRENEIIADLIKLTETDNWRVKNNG